MKEAELLAPECAVRRVSRPEDLRGEMKVMNMIKPRCMHRHGARLAFPLEFRVHLRQGTARRVAISFKVQQENHGHWDSITWPHLCQTRARHMRRLFRRSC
jgi:hypothetical protein